MGNTHIPTSKRTSLIPHKLTIDNIKSLLRDFTQNYLSPGIAFCVSGPYHLKGCTTLAQLPNFLLPGIYLFEDSEEEIVYIGKASCHRHIGSRVATYFVRDASTGIFKSTSEKSATTIAVYTIGVPKESQFLASAIEEYLILNGRPNRNTNCIRIPASEVLAYY